VGLLAGDRTASVRRVLFAIDLSPAVVSEALRVKAQLIVAYHPPIFRPVTRLVGPGDTMEAQVLRCVARGIAIYSPHTALDSAVRGTNQVLAELADVVDAAPLEPPRLPIEGAGMGRIGRLTAISLAALTAKLKRRTGARCVATVGDPKRSLTRAIVGVGAAGSMPFSQALTAKDVIITGEMRHHDALRVERVGCSAIVLSHWSSERPALPKVAAALMNLVPGLDARVSERDAEPFVRA
jgi:dinuclear metal center YbgI/SA1388 family protein